MTPIEQADKEWEEIITLGYDLEHQYDGPADSSGVETARFDLSALHTAISKVRQEAERGTIKEVLDNPGSLGLMPVAEAEKERKEAEERERERCCDVIRYTCIASLTSKPHEQEG